MTLFTKDQARKRFELWAEAFVSSHNLTRAHNDGDEQAILRAAKSAKLSDKETTALISYLFPTSTSNKHTKRKRLDKDMEDHINGKKLSTRSPVVVRKQHLHKKKVKSALAHKLDSSRGDLTPEDAADAALVKLHEDLPVKIRILDSTSGDVIYNPETHATQYSARRMIKLNLERRIKGSNVSVQDVGGDGLVRLSLSMEYEVNDAHVEVRAKSLASPSDMTIVSATVLCNGQQYDIDPVDQARTPEETARFLQRLAANCALGAA